jgi:predicted DsbA family dithiol-disulfide isomerase
VLFRNYFTDAKNLGEREVLLSAAEEVGVKDAAKVLDSNALAKEVVDDINVSIQSHPMMSGGM